MGVNEALEEFNGLNATEVKAMREVAETNLFFMAQGVLGYDQVNPQTHGALCRFLDTAPSSRLQVLMFRGSIKSTIGTVSRSIQKAPRNPHPYRALITNAVAKKAESFLGEIQGHWTRETSLLRRLYPELVPRKTSGPGSDWSTTQASLAIKGSFKESTWHTVGSGGAATAWHFTDVVADDIIDERHKQSPAEMERVKIWNRSLVSLLDTPEINEILWIGTRKTVDDVYADNVTRMPNLVQFVRFPLENGESIFPQKFTTEFFINLEENQPEEYAHDYANNPVGKGGIDWGEGVIQDFRMSDDGQSVFYADALTKELRRWRLADLDKVITVDPNSGEPNAPDQAAVVVSGQSPRGEIFVLRTRSGRPSPDGLIDWIFEDCLRFRPRIVGIEKAGQQNTIFYFQKRCMEEEMIFGVQPLEHKNREKPLRIRTALDTPLKGKRVYTQAHQATLRFQMKFHPQLAAHNWDEIDAFSWAPTLFIQGETQEEQENRKKVEAKMLRARGLTGYGNSYKHRRLS